MQQIQAGKAIVIEGVCSVGKTTVIEAILGARLVADVTLLVESIRLLDRPPPLPTSAEEARRNETFLIDLDATRWSIAQRWRAAGRNVIAERDLCGTLSISYGYDPQFHSFAHAATRAIELLEMEAFSPPPTAYIWLRAGEDVIQQRVERVTTRHVIGPGFTDATAVARQQAFLAGYFAAIETIVPVLRVAAHGPIEVVTQQVAVCIHNALRMPELPHAAHHAYIRATCEYLLVLQRESQRIERIGNGYNGMTEHSIRSVPDPFNPLK